MPRWVFWLWPGTHWCPELDGLLVIQRGRCEHCGCPDYPPEPPDRSEPIGFDPDDYPLF